MILPDIVPAEVCLAPEQIVPGWQPVLRDHAEFSSFRDRVADNQVMTPIELAYALRFLRPEAGGITPYMLQIRDEHALSSRQLFGYLHRQVQDMRGSGGALGNHELLGLSAMSLLKDRTTPIDLALTYPRFRKASGGFHQALGNSVKPDIIGQELADNYVSWAGIAYTEIEMAHTQPNVSVLSAIKKFFDSRGQQATSAPSLVAA